MNAMLNERAKRAADNSPGPNEAEPWVAAPGLNSSAGYAGSLNNPAVPTSVQAFLGLIPEGGSQRV
jgi:hypothetical protein